MMIVEKLILAISINMNSKEGFFLANEDFERRSELCYCYVNATTMFDTYLTGSEKVKLKFTRTTTLLELQFQK